MIAGRALTALEPVKDWYYWMCIVSVVCYATSLGVYTIYVLALIRYRRTELKCSFYTLCISLAFADMWGIVHKLWRVVPNIVDVKEIYLALGQPLAFVLRAQFVFTCTASMIGNVLLTLNLFTAVVFPMHLHTVWSSSSLHTAIVVQWLLPAILVLLLLLPVGWDFEVENQLAKTPSFAASDLFLTVWLSAWALTQVVITFLFMALYAAMIASLWRHFNLRRQYSGERALLTPTKNRKSTKMPSSVQLRRAAEMRPRLHSAPATLFNGSTSSRAGSNGHTLKSNRPKVPLRTHHRMPPPAAIKHWHLASMKRDSLSIMIDKIATGRHTFGKHVLEKIECRLAVAGLLMGFMQMLVGVHATLSALQLYPDEETREIVHGVVHGLYLQANPYIMLYMSATVRRCFFNVAKCRRRPVSSQNGTGAGAGLLMR